jgi:hypothetical protein
MDLSSATTIGVVAFACFKFAGYFLAFRFLKRIQSAIEATPLLMAGTRTALGLLVGGALYFGWDAPKHEELSFYLLLTFLRIGVWGATLIYFTRKAYVRPARALLYTFGGVLLSSFMDIPAALFAFLIPGGVLFC